MREGGGAVLGEAVVDDSDARDVDLRPLIEEGGAGTKGSTRRVTRESSRPRGRA